MKITLVNVSPTLPGNGVPLICSLLKQAGHSVQMVSLPRHPPVAYEDREIEQLGKLFKRTDMVMIGVYSTYAYRAVQVTEFVRKRFPEMKIVWGGPHCVAALENSLRHADAVCFSEGDECVVKFVEKLEAGDSDYLRTPNMAFKVNGVPLVNRALPPFKNLDGLPFQDFGSVGDFILDKELSPLTKGTLKKYFTIYPFNRPTFWFLTTRGCPHKCAYCNNSRYVSLFGHGSIRRQSVNRFMDELEASLKVFDFVEFVGFADDDFLVRPRKELEEFGERYKKSVGLPFSICASATTFRKEKLEILLDCGLKIVQIGVQSGSQRVVSEVFNRDISVAKSMNAISHMAPYQKTHSLGVLADLIIDNPYETESDIVETCRFVVKMPRGVHIQPFKLIFFPGTPLYEKAVKDGFVDPFDESKFGAFYGKIEYQINYPTLLLLLLVMLDRRGFDRFTPRPILAFLCSRPALAFFAMFPRPVIGLLIRWVRRLTRRHAYLEGRPQES